MSHHHHPDHQASIQEFMNSEHGQGALSALQAQGFDPSTAQQFLQHSAAEAHAHVEQHAQSTGLLGAHPGKSFFAAFAMGLIKGDGVFGALGDGAEGVIAGRIAEAVADKVGIDSGIAGPAAAAVAPFLVSFLKGKMMG